MASRRDTRRLVKALNSLQRVTDLEVGMAATLLAVNGIDNALAFVETLRQRTLPPDQHSERPSPTESKP